MNLLSVNISILDKADLLSSSKWVKDIYQIFAYKYGMANIIEDYTNRFQSIKWPYGVS